MLYQPIKVETGEELVRLLKQSCAEHNEELFMGLSVYNMCNFTFEIDRELANGLLDLANSTDNEEVAACCLGHIEEQKLSEECSNLTKRIMACFPTNESRFRTAKMWFGAIRALCNNYQLLEFDDADRNLLLNVYRQHLHVTQELTNVTWWLFCRDQDKYGTASRSSAAN